MQITTKVYPTAPLHSEGPFICDDGDGIENYFGIVSEYNQPIPGLEHLILIDPSIMVTSNVSSRNEGVAKRFNFYYLPNVLNEDYIEKPRLNKLYRFLGLEYLWTWCCDSAPSMAIGVRPQIHDDQNTIMNKLHEIIEFDENDNDFRDQLQAQISNLVGDSIDLSFTDDDGMIFEYIDLELSDEGIQYLKTIRDMIHAAKEALQPKEPNISEEEEGREANLNGVEDNDAVYVYSTDGGGDNYTVERLAQPNFL